MLGMTDHSTPLTKPELARHLTERGAHVQQSTGRARTMANDIPALLRWTAQELRDQHDEFHRWAAS